MRRIEFALAILFLFPGTPALSATEVHGSDVPEVEITAEVRSGEIPVSEKLHLTKVQVERPALVDDAAAAQWPARGSFWWVVGAIVVAGVILSVVL